MDRRAKRRSVLCAVQSVDCRNPRFTPNIYIALEPAVYAKYTAGGAFELMASQNTNICIGYIPSARDITNLCHTTAKHTCAICVIRMHKCAIARCSTIQLCLPVGLNPLKSAPYYGKQGELSA